MAFILKRTITVLWQETIYFKPLNKMKKNPYFYENNFYLKSDISRLSKLIAHYEIYKKIQNVKGDIFEFGVFKGVSLIRFLSFINLFEKKNKRMVYAFDSFGNFPTNEFKSDNRFAKHHDLKIGSSISKYNLEKYLNKKKIKNFRLIKGDICETLPKFLDKNRNFKISLLHLDVDVFKPTNLVINYLFKKISKNGIILIDDYLHVKGATKAINNFLKKNKKLKIEKLKFKNRPSYIIKK